MAAFARPILNPPLDHASVDVLLEERLGTCWWLEGRAAIERAPAGGGGGDV
ncbi:MAG: hypothetical protein LRS49_06170 [Desulfurococcales archaeon]|nr:hypothetical protein [Desulfurococcales archaeon]